MASIRCSCFIVVLVAASFCLSAAPASAQNNALRLGPTNTNTYVTFGSTSALGLSTFTIETWFNRQGTGVTTSTGTGGIAALVPLLSKGAAQAENSNVDADYILGINTVGNVIAADFEEGAGGTSPGLNHPISGVTPILNNTWYHAAATYDGTTWRLYLNGELEAELVVGQPTRSDSIQHAGLGTTLNSSGTPSGFFDGTLDEARVWNVARTAAQIRSTINTQNPSDASLIARWGLDEGAGTTVGDSAGTAQNGTITGTNFSWVAGAPFDIAPCAGNPSSMLRFDGVNDYVTFGTASELGLSTFTIETWFKREATGVGNTTGSGGITSLVPLIAKGAPESDGSNVDANYILGINTAGDVLAADFEDTATGLNHPVSGTTALVNNNWYHAAATYDGSTWKLYLNGNLEATLAVGAFTPRFDSIQPAGLATMQKSALAPGQLGFFAGVLDEARIWNVARSQAQIQADMYSQLTSGSGLIARWGLAEGSGTTIADSVGAPFTTGTLTNGPTWTASNSLFDANTGCDDGAFCNGTDTCNGASNGLRCTLHVGDPCVGGPECNDSCNEAADDCAVLAGTGCTDDGNVCTDDECDGAGTCGHPANSDPCDDGISCTLGDACSGGSCAGTPDDASCDDTDVCTDDVCTVGVGCQYTNNTDPCDDGIACTLGDVCAGGSCAGTPDDGSCDDSEVCTDDVCTAGVGCEYANNASACDDGIACTLGDVCAGGSCAGTPDDGSCDDSEICTDDVCTAGIGCEHSNNTAPCDDALFCNGSDTCGGGTCNHTGDPCAGGSECDDSCNEAADNCARTAGTPCTDDGNVCTDDQCDGAGACVHPNNTAGCEDGDLCTGPDACSGGACAPGAAVDCQDADLCTVDSCDSGTGCAHVAEPQPLASCLVALKSSLQLRANADPSKNRLSWKWTRGDAFNQSDLGMPNVDTTYTLCVYDTAASVSALAASIDVAPSSLWADKAPRGFNYLDRTGASDGAQKVQLKPGVATKTRAQVKAGGSSLPMPAPVTPTQYFAKDPKVVAQLISSEGLCLTSDFAGATKNDGGQFKAKAP